MTPEEEKDFRRELGTNKELRTDATMMALLIKGSIDMGKAEDESIVHAAKRTTKDEALTITGRKPSKWKQVRIWMPTVLSVAAVFIAAFAINRTTIESVQTPGQNLAMYAQDITIDYVPSKGITDSTLENQVTTLIGNVEKKVFLTSSIAKLEDYYQMANGIIVLADEEVQDFLEDNKYIIGMALVKAYLLTDNKDEATYILDDMIKAYPKDKEIKDLSSKLRP